MILFGKILYEQGLNHSHSGNISIRDGNEILIKRHGAMLGYLTKKDIVRINLNNDKKVMSTFSNDAAKAGYALYSSLTAAAIEYANGRYTESMDYNVNNNFIITASSDNRKIQAVVGETNTYKVGPTKITSKKPI